MADDVAALVERLSVNGGFAVMLEAAAALTRLSTNVRHWREECGKLNARAGAATEYKARAEKAEAENTFLRADSQMAAQVRIDDFRKLKADLAQRDRRIAELEQNLRAARYHVESEGDATLLTVIDRTLGGSHD